MKRYLAELVGTFFLAMAIYFTGDPMAIGLMFMTMIYLVGPISGAHLNPAVSFAMFLRGRMAVVPMLGYMVAQVVGAALVCALAYFALGSVIPAKMIPAGMAPLAGAIELLLSFVLVSAVLLVMFSPKFKDSQLNGLILGFVLVALASFIGAYNPAVSLGAILANLFAGTVQPGMNEILVYVLLPFVGALIAVYHCKMHEQQNPYQH